MFQKLSPFFLFIFFSVVFSLPIKSQNLFFNSDFEELNLCTEYSQLCSSAAWFYIQPAVTPIIKAGTVPQPLSGKDLLILPIENIYAKPIKRTYVYSMFACPLQKDKKYKLIFYLHTNGKKFYSIDFYMRKKEFLSNNFNADTVQPSIHIDDTTLIKNSNGWNYIEIIYTAKGDEKYCLIGNLSKAKFSFNGNARMNKTGDIFYFIDDISLKPLIAEAICNNYNKNKEKTYAQHLRHTERTETIEEPLLPEFVTDTITVPAVFFETDKAILKPAFKKLIDNLLVKFKGRNISKIDIEGHTDNTGTTERNIVLSKERAEAVRNYFGLRYPLLKENIFAFGKAANFPIADNNTAEGRAKNRRVQIILTYTTTEK
jgi:outer membrane protein OmpA-like peptidoglycan-associated protein